MGSAPKPVKKIVKAVDKIVTKPVKKVAKGIENIAKEGFEEIIEKPGKKIIREVTDTVTGTDKYDKGTPKPAPTPEPKPIEEESSGNDDAARRSMVAGATGSADRRRFVKVKKLS